MDQLELALRRGDSMTEASATLKTVTGNPPLIDKVVTRHLEIAEQRRHIALGRAIGEIEGGTSWYSGPCYDVDKFWPSLMRSLQSDPGWADAVPSLDQSSTDVVSLLADPHSETIRTRGLVIGYVQSGKTANFTATIAKAADAGYRLFIVLSGVHNALRRQTQLRLDQQLYELNKTRWLTLTDEKEDFGNPVKALALVAGTDLRLLAVVKKNVSRLTRLRNWLQQADKEGGLDACPVLIIDDESDQASPNAAKDPELDRNKINSLIVELLGLPRVAYVGYTATPFANVLVNPQDVEDIYPRDFIYALPRPPSYFGSEELFGIDVSEDDEDESTAPHDMIRIVPTEEALLYKVQSKVPFTPVITPSLSDAIRWFVLATAARRVRSGKDQHSSMLIHTTMRVAPQNAYLKVIREAVRRMRSAWAQGSTEEWRSQWEYETEAEPAERFDLEPVSFDQIAPRVDGILSDLKVMADNSVSTDRLIYTDDPATVIAVGGNTLSRGLTLEGLVSSYFLRTAQTYDSLLQMGRWFGYRPGYGDLPRIWTTEDLASDFRFLSEVERDLRREITRMESENATPMDLPVRIRLHSRMQVTAASKMHFAVPGEASYSGQRPQTTYFRYRDQAEITSNRDAAMSLISRAIKEGAGIESQASRTILRGLTPVAVIEFIRAFSFHPDTELRSNLLENYIESQRSYGWLERWNLAIITRQPPAPVLDLGLPDEVRLITRSKLKNSSNAETANIGTLMSKPDRVADLMDSALATSMVEGELLERRNSDQSGLVLLYPIDKDSAPKKGSQKYRVKLDAIDHLIGTAFSFPAAAPGSQPRNVITVDVSFLGRDETLEPEEEYEDKEGDRNEVDLDGA